MFRELALPTQRRPPRSAARRHRAVIRRLTDVECLFAQLSAPVHSVSTPSLASGLRLYREFAASAPQQLARLGEIRSFSLSNDLATSGASICSARFKSPLASHREARQFAARNSYPSALCARATSIACSRSCSQPRALARVRRSAARTVSAYACQPWPPSLSIPRSTSSTAACASSRSPAKGRPRQRRRAFTPRGHVDPS